jgi:hypothetical protein
MSQFGPGPSSPTGQRHPHVRGRAVLFEVVQDDRSERHLAGHLGHEWMVVDHGLQVAWPA